MRTRRRQRRWLEQYGGIIGVGIAIVAVVVLVILLLSSGGKDEDEKNDSFKLNDTEIEELTKNTTNDTENLENKAQRVKTDSEMGRDGLCEDYFFEQGDTLDIASHTVTVNKIASSALRLQVDGENAVLGLGDEKRLGDGVKIRLFENDLVFFGTDDPVNAVNLRIGCDHDEQPIDKLVEKRGSEVCKALYDQCQESFEYDTED